MDEATGIDPYYNYQFVLKDQYLPRLIEAKQRCLRTRRWKLVCTPTDQGTRHYGLFQIAKDPHGELDLAATRPEVLAPMQAALERWMDHQTESSIADDLPPRRARVRHPGQDRMGSRGLRPVPLPHHRTCGTAGCWLKSLLPGKSARMRRSNPVTRAFADLTANEPAVRPDATVPLFGNFQNHRATGSQVGKRQPVLAGLT